MYKHTFEDVQKCFFGFSLVAGCLSAVKRRVGVIKLDVGSKSTYLKHVKCKSLAHEISIIHTRAIFFACKSMQSKTHSFPTIMWQLNMNFTWTNKFIYSVLFTSIRCSFMCHTPRYFCILLPFRTKFN